MKLSRLKLGGKLLLVKMPIMKINLKLKGKVVDIKL